LRYLGDGLKYLRLSIKAGFPPIAKVMSSAQLAAESTGSSASRDSSKASTQLLPTVCEVARERQDFYHSSEFLDHVAREYDVGGRR
jgi:hypothetical protein